MDACDIAMADAKQKATIILVQSSLNKKPAGASRSVPSGEGADGGGSWINFQKIRSKSVTVVLEFTQYVKGGSNSTPKDALSSEGYHNLIRSTLTSFSSNVGFPTRCHHCV